VQYICTPDTKYFVCVAQDEKLFSYDRAKSERINIFDPKKEKRYSVRYYEAFSISPSGRYIAFAYSNAAGKKLYVFDSLKKVIIYSKLLYGYPECDELAWSPDDNIFYIQYTRGRSHVFVAKIKDMDVELNKITPTELEYSRVYDYKLWGWHLSTVDDQGYWAIVRYTKKYGFVEFYKGPNLTDDYLFTLPKDFIEFGGRDHYFNYAVMLKNGLECLIDDEDSIYLVNIKEKKVGKVCDGTSFILLDERFEQARGVEWGLRNNP
jgi:WD40-like Beta Propeller Repeat